MPIELSVETFRPQETTRQQAKAGRIHVVWNNHYVVRIWNQKTQTAVHGGGSSLRVAAQRAIAAAVAEGWF